MFFFSKFVLYRSASPLYLFRFFQLVLGCCRVLCVGLQIYSKYCLLNPYSFRDFDVFMLFLTQNKLIQKGKNFFLCSFILESLDFDRFACNL